jgi:hypothetical protein
VIDSLRRSLDQKSNKHGGAVNNEYDPMDSSKGKQKVTNTTQGDQVSISIAATLVNEEEDTTSSGYRTANSTFLYTEDPQIEEPHPPGKDPAVPQDLLTDLKPPITSNQEEKLNETDAAGHSTENKKINGREGKRFSLKLFQR